MYHRKSLMKNNLQRIQFLKYELTLSDLIIPQSSLDRGYGRCLVYRKAQTNLKKYPNQTFDRVVGPSKDPISGEVISNHKVWKFSLISPLGSKRFTF